RHVARRRRRHLHGEVLHERLELDGLRDEVGLAVHLDQDTDAAARMDVRADRAVGRRTGGLLGRLGETLLAQDAERLVDVALGLGERLLALDEPRAGLLAELLHELQAHATGASTCSSTTSRDSSPPFAADGSPAPRWRSS